MIVESISNNGGRSCVNASGVWVTRHADRIAEALATRLAQVPPRAADDPEAVLAPFADPATARRISAMIDQDGAGRRRSGHARASLSLVRDADRVVTAHGGTYLLPTIVRCDADHALANREFLFPFASVVEVPAERLPECLGPSLVVTCISNDPAFQRALRRILARRPPQHRPDSHDTDRLGPAARGQPVRTLYARRAYRGRRRGDVVTVRCCSSAVRQSMIFE